MFPVHQAQQKNWCLSESISSRLRHLHGGHLSRVGLARYLLERRACHSLRALLCNLLRDVRVHNNDLFSR